MNNNPYSPPSDIETVRDGLLGGFPRVLAQKLIGVIASYGLIAIMMLCWHLIGSTSFDQPSIGLMSMFSIAAALVGLLLIWFVSGVLNWGQRIGGLILVAAVLVGMLVWDPDLLWQMLRLHAAQAACLAIAFATFRLFGWTIWHPEMETSNLGQADLISVRGLAALAVAMAIACATLLLHPDFFAFYVLLAVLVAGGCGNAALTLAAVWISLSDSHWAARSIAFVVIAPMGGVIYLVASMFIPLLFNGLWFAGVTTLQMALTVLPLAVARRHGFVISREKLTSETLSLADSECEAVQAR